MVQRQYTEIQIKGDTIMAYQNYSLPYPQYYQNYAQNYPQNSPQIPPVGMQQQTPPQQQSNNNIIWVQGEAGAKSYLVAPNNTVQLWDSESRKIYLKSADASGMPSMKVLNYTIEGEEREKTPSQHPNDYATHEELTALENRILEKFKEVTSA